MSVVDRFRKHALDRDAPAVDALLRGLADDERAELRAWLVGGDSRSFLEECHRSEYRDLNRDQELMGTGIWTHTMGAIAVCSPIEAVKTIRWRDLWDHQRPVARELALKLLEDKPREWVAPFVEAAAAVTMPVDDARHAGWLVGWLVGRAVLHHGLPCPSGLMFLSNYLQDGWQQPLDAERLRAEPLMPDVIHHMIGAGVIAQLAALPEIAPVLVEEGRLERARLIESCLASLTVDQRVGSQRVVAKLISALELRTDEVSGGLAFLTGVIATRDGSVGAALLPLAVALVGDAAGLEELTRVVAGRKEKKQKQVLLKALRDPAMAERAGLDGVLVALEVLAEGQEDAGLLKELTAARAELGAPEPAVEEESVPAGLWQLDPDPGPEPAKPFWLRDDFLWSYYLDRRQALHSGATELATTRFVHAVASGEYDGAAVAKHCHDLRVAGRLAVNRLVPLVEAAFLAGCLRGLWSAALEIANDLASASRTPAGLPDLLRMLTRYAVEVPDGGSLPSHLATAAGRGGSTLLQLEARALGAALARVDVGGFRPEEAGVASSGARGLWELRVPTAVLARVAHAGYAHSHDIEDHNLTYLLDVNLGIGERDRNTGARFVSSRDAQAVDWLAGSVQRTGLQATREHVRRLRRAQAEGPAAVALRGWADGAIDASTYGDQGGRIWTDMPAGLPRVVFAWWCEQLVLLETHPGLLSRPDSGYGYIDLGRLVERVRHLHGIARPGPLDVVLALTRLQPRAAEDPDPAELLSGLDGLELWTEPVGAPSFDAVPVIRRWVGAGGPTAPELPLDLGLVPGLTETDLLGPGQHLELLTRVRPGDPEVTGEVRLLRFHPEDPWLVDGRISRKVWSQTLAPGLGTDHAWTQDRTLNHIAELAQHDGVLTPEVTVAVAVQWLDGGHLSLARFTEGLQWLYEHGGLRALWSLGLGVADAAAVRSPKPNGLAVLLAALATYAGEVPPAERSVPAGIRTLAGSKGSTKSHAAARSLVAALEVSS